jgi:hypothetical protein
MSALRHSRRFREVACESVLPSRPDIVSLTDHVGKVQQRNSPTHRALRRAADAHWRRLARRSAAFLVLIVEWHEPVSASRRQVDGPSAEFRDPFSGDALSSLAINVRFLMAANAPSARPTLQVSGEAKIFLVSKSDAAKKSAGYRPKCAPSRKNLSGSVGAGRRDSSLLGFDHPHRRSSTGHVRLSLVVSTGRCNTLS